MSPEEAFALIVAALEPLNLDLSKTADRRVYVAYLTARLGRGEDSGLAHRLVQLRSELGL